MSLPTPKTSLDFVDNTGALVTCLVSDPVPCVTLDCPAVSERAPCPSVQREGPDGMADFADTFAQS
jgi:hypothetical protein